MAADDSAETRISDQAREAYQRILDAHDRFSAWLDTHAVDRLVPLSAQDMAERAALLDVYLQAVTDGNHLLGPAASPPSHPDTGHDAG